MTNRERLGYAALVTVAAAAAIFHFARTAAPPDAGVLPAGPPTDQASDTIAGRKAVIDSLRSKSKLAPQDVTFLIESIAHTSTDEALIQARAAIVVSADRLKHADMAPEDRARIETSLLATLGNPLWRVRLSGLGALANYPIPNRPDISERM